MRRAKPRGRADRLSRGRRLLFAVVAAIAATVAGCENGMKDMYDQSKYKPLAASRLWPDGRASRPLEADTVAHSAGTLAGTSSGRNSLEQSSNQTQATYTQDTLTRGRERFGIFCEPCHGPAGDGDGFIARRGFSRPPTYHSDRLRGVSDQYLYDVIKNGYGDMYPYGDRVDVSDRWAIVAYIRALQLAEHATMDEVPAAQRASLAGAHD
jgi:mono/diheme cytochrome c family protein